MKILKEIENEIESILKNYPDAIVPIFDSNYQEDKLIVEIEHVYYVDYYILSYCERGKKNELIKTKELNEFIFEVCKIAIREIASNFETDNCLKSIDNRILLFSKEIDILQTLPLEVKYLNRLKTEYNNLLKLNLFKNE